MRKLIIPLIVFVISFIIGNLSYLLFNRILNDYQIYKVKIMIKNEENKKIDILISNLSMEDIKWYYGYVHFCYLDDYSSNELIKIGEQATNKLIDVLDDENKGVVADMVLSYIWDQELIKMGIIKELNGHGNYIYFPYFNEDFYDENGKLLWAKTVLNSDVIKKGSFCINKAKLKENKKYWESVLYKYYSLK